MSELEEDIKHCEEVLADWHGCDECKSDHERLLSYMKELQEYRNMRYYVVSEEDLKDFIRTSKRYGFACECVFYSPSEKELEVTEENLKRFKELNEYIKEHSISITDKKYEGMKAVSNCTKNCASEEVHYDVSEDFKEILKELKQLDINIYNLIQFYDCDEIKGADYYLVHDTREFIKKCIEYIKTLSFMRDKE